MPNRAAITPNQRIWHICIVAASVQALTIAARALKTRKRAGQGICSTLLDLGLQHHIKRRPRP
jgi:hypothetical protein